MCMCESVCALILGFFGLRICVVFVSKCTCFLCSYVRVCVYVCVLFIYSVLVCMSFFVCMGSFVCVCVCMR